MHIFMLRGSTAIIWSYLFKLFNLFRFRRPFWIFRFLPFFDRKLLSKCVIDAYFRSQKVKTYQIDYFAWKISLFCKWSFFSYRIAYLIGFDLLRTKICVIATFGEQLPVKKRLKLKNSKWPPKPEVMQKLKRIA